MSKKSPQDATLRNVRASRKADAELRRDVKDLIQVVKKLTTRVYALEVAAGTNKR
jgi:hypothetical protein